MVGWLPSKQIKMLIVWLAKIACLEFRNQVKLLLNTSKESGQIHVYVGFFCDFLFAYKNRQYIIPDYGSLQLKHIILLPDRWKKNATPHSCISQ